MELWCNHIMDFIRTNSNLRNKIIACDCLQIKHSKSLANLHNCPPHQIYQTLISIMSHSCDFSQRYARSNKIFLTNIRTELSVHNYPQYTIVFECFVSWKVHTRKLESTQPTLSKATTRFPLAGIPNWLRALWVVCFIFDRNITEELCNVPGFHGNMRPTNDDVCVRSDFPIPEPAANQNKNQLTDAVSTPPKSAGTTTGRFDGEGSERGEKTRRRVTPKENWKGFVFNIAWEKTNEWKCKTVCIRNWTIIYFLLAQLLWSLLAAILSCSLGKHIKWKYSMLLSIRSLSKVDSMCPLSDAARCLSDVQLP